MTLAVSTVRTAGTQGYHLPLAIRLVQEWLGRGLDIALMLSGGLLLTLAWIQARPRRGEPAHSALRQSLLTAVAWSLPLVVGLPFGSTDAHAYLDQGWQLAHGMNPYRVGLGTDGGPLAAYVDPTWVGTTTVYPPLSLRWSQLAVWVGQEHPYGSIVALHVLDLIVLLIGGWALARLAADIGRDVRTALWWYLNPLTILAGIAGLHHEVLMTTLVLVGLMLARTRYGLVTGTAVVAVATAVKQPAVLVLPALVLASVPAVEAARGGVRLWGRIAARAGVAAVSLVATFLAMTAAAGLGSGWIHALRVPGSVLSLSPTALLGDVAGFLSRLHGHPLPEGAANGPVARVLVPVVALGLIVMIARLAPHGWPTLAWVGPLAFALASPTLWPWYLIPIPVMFGLERLSPDGVRRRIAFVVAVAFVQLVIEETDFQLYGSLAMALALAAATLLYTRRHPALARSLAAGPQGPVRSVEWARHPSDPQEAESMSRLSRDQIRTMMAEVLANQGKTLPADDTAALDAIGFRSLDFSELALSVEDELGTELNFDAPGLRSITTVSDVLDFIEQLQDA
ncbi:polyprenol phosphomannose-dependent alpha 1,6 mannosyltransferase MptB [Raineyella fluvialis]|uniref:Carrier domain-containing protein n=1 Tax=Raineyella fluvialis TaxID=2662261 RepID=A0A5Q2FB20_9ACTN|nr:polyprenol phosphomannose-dependent alpha 1,6 mannosyltransferase MptB [Raineyella fluvialis]QGF23591.1 hypothetical protein Rai3103_07825 [Raineyella fluvialis]